VEKRIQRNPAEPLRCHKEGGERREGESSLEREKKPPSRLGVTKKRDKKRERETPRTA
jgi:hypothetical protein